LRCAASEPSGVATLRPHRQRKRTHRSMIGNLVPPARPRGALVRHRGRDQRDLPLLRAGSCGV